MTKREAQERNWNLGILKGQLPRLKRIIPQDIKDKMQQRDLRQFLEFAERLLECIEDARIKRFTCDDCHEHGPRPTLNKKATVCDFCGSWDKTLYTVKRKKK